MLCISIVINADQDPDPSYLSECGPDPGSQTNADPDPGQTLMQQIVEFLNEKWT